MANLSEMRLKLAGMDAKLRSYSPNQMVAYADARESLKILASLPPYGQVPPMPRHHGALPSSQNGIKNLLIGEAARERPDGNTTISHSAGRASRLQRGFNQQFRPVGYAEVHG